MAVHLLGNLYQVGGGEITHPLDGAIYALLHENGHAALIDCGLPISYEALTRELGSIGVNMHGIDAVYGTHCHLDHVGGMSNMPADVPLLIHKNDQLAVTIGDQNLSAAFLYDIAMPVIKNVVTIEDEHEVAVEASVLRAIHTPGHTPGSMCYSITTSEGTVLIAGDTLWGGFSERINSNWDDWRLLGQIGTPTA